MLTRQAVSPEFTSAPRRIVVLHTGGLGDLVLASGFLSALRAHFSRAHITLLCRESIAPVTALYPFELDTVIPVSLDAHRSSVPTPELHRMLGPLLEGIADIGCDVFVGADLVPTWLTPVVGAALVPRLAVGRPAPQALSAMVDAIHGRFGLTPIAPVADECGKDTPELERYSALLRLMGIDQAAFPTLAVPANADQQAIDAIAACSKDGAPMLACFNAPGELRRWATPAFVKSICDAATELSLSPLLFGGSGSIEERRHVEELGSAIRARGIEPAVVPEDFPLPIIAGMLRHCRAFIGADTGFVHLAGALGVPGVAAYGGGTWPAYKPWAPATIGVVHPLPCFGCSWDCAFGHAICVESVDSESVLRGLRTALGMPEIAPSVIECATLSQAELTIIGDAARHYKAAEDDRNLRLNALTRLKDSAEADQRRLSEMMARLQSARARIRDLENTRVSKEAPVQVADLQQKLVRKEAELQSIATALREQSALVQTLSKKSPRTQEPPKTLTLEDLEKRLEQKEAELQRIAGAAKDLRESLERKEVELQRITAESRQQVTIIAQLNAALQAQRAAAEHPAPADMLAAEREAIQAENEELRRAADERLTALEASTQALLAIEAEGERRSTLLAELTTVLEERDAEILRLKGRGKVKRE